MKKTRNDRTGVVHGLTGEKFGPLEVFITACGYITGLFWLKVNRDEPVTCTKCLSVLRRGNDG